MCFLNSGAVGLVRMGDSCYNLLGQVTEFLAVKVKTLLSVINSEEMRARCSAFDSDTV